MRFMTFMDIKTRRLNPLLLQEQSHFASQNKEDIPSAHQRVRIFLRKTRRVICLIR